MTFFKVFPKRKPSPGGLNSSEACVYCRTGFVDFADILGNGTLLGCYVCGGVFMSSDCRAHEKEHKAEQLKRQEEQTVLIQPVVLEEIGGVEVLKEIIDSTDETTSDTGVDVQTIFTAKCGKECKSRAGLQAHERACELCKTVS